MRVELDDVPISSSLMERGNVRCIEGSDEAGGLNLLRVPDLGEERRLKKKDIMNMMDDEEEEIVQQVSIVIENKCTLRDIHIH